jgi:hypothetical protein
MGIAAEGEGFEPSIRLTTDNGFRDRLESAYLQGSLLRFASGFASNQPCLLDFAELEHFIRHEGVLESERRLSPKPLHLFGSVASPRLASSSRSSCRCAFLG